MKKTILIVILAMIMALSGCIFGPTTHDAGSYTIDLPMGFSEDSEGAYISTSPEMYVDTFYFANELGMDIELMSDLIVYTEFMDEDIIDTDLVEINGVEAVQIEYKTLTESKEGDEYYYFGILTFLALDEEILVVDIYVAMDIVSGAYADLSDSDRETIKELANTIKITDSDYEGDPVSSEKFEAAANTLNLSDNWFEAVDGENGMYEFGYYALYENYDLYLYYQFESYDDNNANDLGFVAENAQSMRGYSYAGNTTIAGEAADIYKYEALEDEDAYIYGVTVISEHYYADVFGYTYNDDYEFSQDTIDNIVEYATDID